MSQRAKNWRSRQVAMTGAYINLLDTPGGGAEFIDRRGIILFNTTGVDVLVNPNDVPVDGTSYTLSFVAAPTNALDFADQPPIKYLWVKAVSGNLLVWEA